MRPDPCLAVLGGFLLAGLLLPLKADSKDDCSTEVRVQRNTKYDVFQGEQLRIQCPVSFCSLPPPTVVWLKVDETLIQINSSSSRGTKIVWKQTERLEGTYFLIFERIHRNNSGLYRCTLEGSVSHSIRVQVHGKNEPFETKTTNNTNYTTEAERPPNYDDMSWLYVYCGSGIALFVVMVIVISIVSMRGCRVKPKETQTGNQSAGFPMAEQSVPHGRLQLSPRGSPVVPPCQRSVKRQLAEGTPPGNNLQLHPPRERGVATGDNASSVLYVTLNLQQRPAARTTRTEESTSEYAAIRVK